MKKIVFLSFIFLFSFNFVSAQNSGELVMTPGVIDETVSVREMLEYEIKLKNNGTSKMNIYPIVEEMEKQEKGNTEGSLERQYMLTKWISIKRNSIEIMPGEEITLPLKIEVSHDALPDNYFSSITFAYGSNRLDAEERIAKTNPPKLIINLKVEDQTIEKASILKYFPVKNFFVNVAPSFSLEINNSGNVDIVPVGKIYIYDKKGREVNEIIVNSEFTKIIAGELGVFNITGAEKIKTGKYKARLEVEYGDKLKRDLQDTVYIMVVTLPFLIFFGTGILLFTIILSMIIFRKTHPRMHAPRQVVGVEEKKEVINLKEKR